mmetsp:Transcript_14102/g.27386  ORF Transcript_14102/g.27386 Transcript_14102/m.27386 type:complete len:252 (-) Transcript_14102:107-862(-)
MGSLTGPVRAIVVPYFDDLGRHLLILVLEAKQELSHPHQRDAFVKHKVDCVQSEYILLHGLMRLCWSPFQWISVGLYIGVAVEEAQEAACENQKIHYAQRSARTTDLETKHKDLCELAAWDRMILLALSLLQKVHQSLTLQAFLQEMLTGRVWTARKDIIKCCTHIHASILTVSPWMLNMYIDDAFALHYLEAQFQKTLVLDQRSLDLYFYLAFVVLNLRSVQLEPRPNRRCATEQNLLHSYCLFGPCRSG